LNRKILQLEIEREAIRREKDDQKLIAIEEQLANWNAERDIFSSKWNQEKEFVEKIQQAKNKIEQLKLEAEQAERNGNFARVAEIRYGDIVNLDKEIKENENALSEIQVDQKLMKEVVTSEDIAEIVSKWTGIPVQSMLQTEKEKLIGLEDVLKQRVVGQDEAVEVVSNAIIRSRAGLQNPNKPIGSFLFLGSTGVGKTELAKALAAYLFNDENAYIRIDMSEYQEKHAISRLVGAPPGYVGYEESGQLTEAVRRKPYSVVLFDEIEKAHPDTFNILLQMLDDGRLTDNKGRLINFKNTIIIMTSNIGSEIILNEFEGLEENEMYQKIPFVQNELLNHLKKTVKPEFINRIDDIVLFLPLRKRVIESIVRIQLKEIEKLLEVNKLKIDINDLALEYLAEKGYEPDFGARPIKRLIQKEIVNGIAKKIISGEIQNGDTIIIDFLDNEVVIYPKR
jgi:ATP-dependent Clp protease ATP-binding subunit ClpB